MCHLVTKKNSVSPLIFLLYQYLISLRCHSVQSVRTCYPYHAATAVLDKEVFPIVPLKSGMSCHFRPDSLLHFIPLSATRKLTILQITDHLATAFSASDSALLTYSALYKLLWMNEWMKQKAVQLMPERVDRWRCKGIGVPFLGAASLIVHDFQGRQPIGSGLGLVNCRLWEGWTRKWWIP